MFDGKMKVFRSEGGTVKTDEEKRQMAEKRRFKKERDFKQRLTEQEENEEADIRSFTFHRHELKPERKPRTPREFSDSEETRRPGKPGFSRKPSDSRKGRFQKDGKYPQDDRKSRSFKNEKPNRGGHERFDRQGGDKRKNNKRFNRDED